MNQSAPGYVTDWLLIIVVQYWGWGSGYAALANGNPWSPDDIW